jgi:hypothetical protein
MAARNIGIHAERDAVHAQPFSCHVLNEKLERLAGVGNHQARAVDGHGQHGLVVQRGRLACAL